MLKDGTESPAVDIIQGIRLLYKFAWNEIILLHFVAEWFNIRLAAWLQAKCNTFP